MRSEHRFDDLLHVEPTGADGRYVADPPGDGFLFGGLTMALLLRAAGLTVAPGLQPKSLHALFLNHGRWGPTLGLAIDRLTDSRAFATRRVAAEQGDKTIVSGLATFHIPEAGDDWQEPMPDVPPPESLDARPARFGSGSDPIEIRPTELSAPGFSEVIHPYWAKARHELPADDLLGWSALLFTTDYMVIGTPFPRGTRSGERMVSRTLEHSAWFHRPVLDDDWLLYACDATTVVGGRYLARGTVHDRDGRLLASFAQQGMIRPAAEAPAS